MKNKTCYIVGAGEVSDAVLPAPGDFVIAADGGYRFLAERGIRADMVVGDFDSLEAVPDHPNMAVHPAVKNDTDMMLAVKTGLEMGFSWFVINGGLGGRLDHTLANIQTLTYIARRGGRGYLVGAAYTATVIENGRLLLRGRAGDYISVFCLGDMARGVTLRGLKYSLTDAELTHWDPLGVSNEFTEDDAEIQVADGTLAVLWSGATASLPEL